MGSPRDENLQAAQADMNRIHQELLKLEAERDAASDRVDRIADEPFNTPQEEADISRRVMEADQEVMQILERIAEVEGDFERAQQNFDDEISGVHDEEEGDDD